MNSCQMRAGHVPPYTVMLVVGGDIVTSSVGNPAHTAVESDEAYPQNHAFL